ncbi:MAG: undecaprenyl-diphosphate phosphatase [Treponema sp.]|nr:undecaprenyl-diphosphate phosphatase [Treponema sp.]
MSTFHAVILGLVQGITEFVPVSSSGHLVLLQKAFGIEMPGLFFDVMLHVGTLLAVLLVLRREILAILRRPLSPLTGFIIIATIPAVLAALFFREALEGAFATGQFLGPSFLLTSVLLCMAELLYRRSGQGLLKTAVERRRNLSLWDALVVGLFQALAILPGVSRSGACLTGALSRRIDRDLAARFSFLLAIPAILGALVWQLRDLYQAAQRSFNPALLLEQSGLSGEALAAGTLAAAAAGFCAVHFMLKIIREKSLFFFALYTAILGTLILVDQFVTRIIF